MSLSDHQHGVDEASATARTRLRWTRQLHQQFVGAVSEAPSDSSAQMQTDVLVKRKLFEQIEVQRHLQLRMEAQGRYLQSVLRRAHQVLADNCMAEAAKAELSELVSAADTECLSSSSLQRRHRSADSSCLTSSSSSDAESKATRSKRLYTSMNYDHRRYCTVEQPVLGKRTFPFLQRMQAEQEAEAAAEPEEADDVSSSEIDLNM